MINIFSQGHQSVRGTRKIEFREFLKNAATPFHKQGRGADQTLDLLIIIL